MAAIPPLNFALSKNYGNKSCFRKFLSKMQHLKLKTHILEQCRDQIKILSTRNVFCRKLSLSIGKLQLPLFQPIMPLTSSTTNRKFTEIWNELYNKTAKVQKNQKHKLGILMLISLTFCKKNALYISHLQHINYAIKCYLKNNCDTAKRYK